MHLLIVRRGVPYTKEEIQKVKNRPFPTRLFIANVNVEVRDNTGCSFCIRHDSSAHHLDSLACRNSGTRSGCEHDTPIIMPIGHRSFRSEMHSRYVNLGGHEPTLPASNCASKMYCMSTLHQQQSTPSTSGGCHYLQFTSRQVCLD